MTLYQAISHCKTEKDIENICLTHLEQVDNEDSQAIEYLYKLYMRNREFDAALVCAERLWTLNKQEFAEYGLKIADAYLVAEEYQSGASIYQQVLRQGIEPELKLKARFQLIGHPR